EGDVQPVDDPRVVGDAGAVDVAEADLDVGGEAGRRRRAQAGPSISSATMVASSRRSARPVSADAAAGAPKYACGPPASLNFCFPAASAAPSDVGFSGSP